MRTACNLARMPYRRAHDVSRMQNPHPASLVHSRLHHPPLSTLPWSLLQSAFTSRDGDQAQEPQSTEQEQEEGECGGCPSRHRFTETERGRGRFFSYTRTTILELTLYTSTERNSYRSPRRRRWVSCRKPCIWNARESQHCQPRCPRGDHARLVRNFPRRQPAQPAALQGPRHTKAESLQVHQVSAGFHVSEVRLADLGFLGSTSVEMGFRHCP